jgi:ADP-ribose pyrophosphatase YjhB (NUDIX family)
MRKAVRAIVLKDDALLVMHRNKFGSEYYTLVGGGIDAGETADQALHREIMEETSLRVSSPKLVFIEEAGEPFGTQYIYLCTYESGEVALAADSDEAKINELGKNLYLPEWMPVAKLPDIPFVSETLKATLIDCLLHGFPKEPLTLKPRN